MPNSLVGKARTLVNGNGSAAARAADVEAVTFDS
jgi:hypothetical protein